MSTLTHKASPGGGDGPEDPSPASPARPQSVAEKMIARAAARAEAAETKKRDRAALCAVPKKIVVLCAVLAAGGIAGASFSEHHRARSVARYLKDKNERIEAANAQLRAGKEAHKKIYADLREYLAPNAAPEPDPESSAQTETEDRMIKGLTTAAKAKAKEAKAGLFRLDHGAKAKAGLSRIREVIKKRRHARMSEGSVDSLAWQQRAETMLENLQRMQDLLEEKEMQLWEKENELEFQKARLRNSADLETEMATYVNELASGLLDKSVALPEGLISKPYIVLSLARKANAEWGSRPGAGKERAKQAEAAALAAKALFRSADGAGATNDASGDDDDVLLQPQQAGPGGTKGKYQLRGVRGFDPNELGSFDD